MSATAATTTTATTTATNVAAAEASARIKRLQNETKKAKENAQRAKENAQRAEESAQRANNESRRSLRALSNSRMTRRNLNGYNRTRTNLEKTDPLGFPHITNINELRSKIKIEFNQDKGLSSEHITIENIKKAIEKIQSTFETSRKNKKIVTQKGIFINKKKNCGEIMTEPNRSTGEQYKECKNQIKVNLKTLADSLIKLREFILGKQQFLSNSAKLVTAVNNLLKPNIFSSTINVTDTTLGNLAQLITILLYLSCFRFCSPNSSNNTFYNRMDIEYIKTNFIDIFVKKYTNMELSARHFIVSILFKNTILDAKNYIESFLLHNDRQKVIENLINTIKEIPTCVFNEHYSDINETRRYYNR